MMNGTADLIQEENETILNVLDKMLNNNECVNFIRRAKRGEQVCEVIKKERSDTFVFEVIIYNL